MSSEPSPFVPDDLLKRATAGHTASVERLMDVVYDELHSLAGRMLRRENAGHTLQSSALVNEAYLRLVDQTRVDWQGKSHFLAIGAQMMRRILVDHARSKRRDKRGGGWQRVELHDDLQVTNQNDEDVLAIEDALEKLAKLDPIQAKIVELRFYGGLKVSEVAEALNMSKRKVELEWTMIKAWMRRELESSGQA